MRSIARVLNRLRPNDGITPNGARPAPYRPNGPYTRHPDDYVPLRLPAENPNLLLAYPNPVGPDGTPRPRPACLILGTSRLEHEHQRRVSDTADALAFELAVAENLLILHPDDVDAAAVRDVLHAALPVVVDRVALQLAVTS